MRVSKGEKLGVCIQCGKKGVYTKRGWNFGYGTLLKVCRYCGKVQPQKSKGGE